MSWQRLSQETEQKKVDLRDGFKIEAIPFSMGKGNELRGRFKRRYSQGY